MVPRHCSSPRGLLLTPAPHLVSSPSIAPQRRLVEKIFPVLVGTTTDGGHTYVKYEFWGADSSYPRMTPAVPVQAVERKFHAILDTNKMGR